MSETRVRLAEIFRRQFGEAPAEGEDMRAGERSSWDSIAHINLVLAVEQEFAVTFSPEEASIADSFEAMREFLSEKVD